MEDFELELKQALERRPAPPSLKRRLMARRREQQEQRRRAHSIAWMRIAASLLDVALVGGAADWGVHRVEDRRKGEAARRQVMTALRITNHALNEVNTRLAAHDHGTGE